MISKKFGSISSKISLDSEGNEPKTQVNMENSAPIGLFDSGIGGLTVMKEVIQLLPHENLIYLGDTARIPYGTRSSEIVQKYTLEAVSFLLKKNIKLLIIACHTACSQALEIIQKQLQIPVIGIVQSGYKKLMSSTKNHRVAILGTPSTIESSFYQNWIQRQHPQTKIFPISCSLFVPFAEEGLFDHPATKLITEYYLNSLKGKKIDCALLACSHYPLIRPIIQQTLGSDVLLIDPAEDVAQETKRALNELKCLNKKETSHFQFYATDNPKKFAQFAHLFFKLKINAVSQAHL